MRSTQPREDLASTELMSFSIVSVVIPARNEERNIGRVVDAVNAQRAGSLDIEVLVVDDGSVDRTAKNAADSGARVITIDREHGGNPAAARNKGAAASRGDPIIFLDANCIPREDWLKELLSRHLISEAEVVGGSLALPSGLPATAQCDYYCGCYHVHPKRPAGSVSQHPPGNLSVRRESFLSTNGYDDRHPIAYSHEELGWQAEVLRNGGKIYFDPQAIVDHYNRSGLGNLLRRNYRWGYSAIQSKQEVRITRFPWLYRYPVVPIFVSIPAAPIAALYIVFCWARAGIYTPLLQLPLVFLARFAYGVAMALGGIRWLLSDQKYSEFRPKWE